MLKFVSFIIWRIILCSRVGKLPWIPSNHREFCSRRVRGSLSPWYVAARRPELLKVNSRTVPMRRVSSEHLVCTTLACFRGSCSKLNSGLPLKSYCWTYFLQESLGIRDFPQSTPTSKKENDPFWKKFHHALLGIRVKEGYLVCPDSGRRFPILYVKKN